MNDKLKELKQGYEQNLIVELQNQLLRRQHQQANMKLLAKIRKEFEKLVNEGGAGSPEADRMIRVIRNLDDMILTADKGIVDIDKQFKELMDLVKVRYPDAIEADRIDLEDKLRQHGLLDSEVDKRRAELIDDTLLEERPRVLEIDGEGEDNDYEIGAGNKATD